MTNQRGKPWANKAGLLEGNAGFVVSQIPYTRLNDEVTTMDERCESCDVLMEWDDMPLTECESWKCRRRICSGCRVRNKNYCRQCVQESLKALYG